MRKLNILFITHEGQFGGASKQLIVLANAFKEKGYGVTILTPFKNSPVNKVLNDNNIDAVSSLFGWWKMPSGMSIVKKLIFKLLYKFNIISLIFIKRKLKRYKFDIVHSNSSVINIGVHIAKIKKAKHIWHFREYNSEFLDFIDNSNKSYMFINENAERIIYVSNALKNHYEKKINPNLGCVIYDGVEGQGKVVKKFNRNLNGNLSLLIAATLEENKGQLIAIRAIRLLHQRGYKGVKLFLAGKDSSNYKKTLDNMIKEYDLNESIIFLGYIENMKTLRKNMDIELICSKYEAFGLSTVEAMMSSNPVIGTNISATSELIISGYNGLLFDYNSAEALAESIEFFINNPDKLKEYGENAFDYAMKNYSNEIMIKKIEDIYQDIIK